MPKIVVARPFVLSAQGGEKFSFAVGMYEVEQWVADHWFTKFHLQPEGTPANDPNAQATVQTPPTITDGGVLSQALSASEAAANVLRGEVTRLTNDLSEMYIRATRAEAAVASTSAPTAGPNDNAELQSKLIAAEARANIAEAKVAELEASVSTATDKVTGLTDELTPVPDETIGNYIVRRVGRKFNVLQLATDGSITATVAEGLSKEDAEAKAAELKAA